LVSFSAVPEGYYTLEATEANHDSARYTIYVTAGQDNDEQIFLSRQTVRLYWEVVPTTIPDRTQIVVRSTFESNVPIPVVTVDPAYIDLSGLTLIGQKMQVDMVLTNHGLIAANDVALHFGTHPFYQIQPLVDRIGTLPASSSLAIPVLIMRIADFSTLTVGLASEIELAVVPGGAADDSAAAMQGPTLVPCGIPAWMDYTYPCGPQSVQKQVPIPITGVEGDCAPSMTGKGIYIPPPPPASGPLEPVPATTKRTTPAIRPKGQPVLSVIPVSSQVQDCIPRLPGSSNDCKLACWEGTLEYDIVKADLTSVLKRLPLFEEPEFTLSLSGAAEACLCCDGSISAKLEAALTGAAEGKIPIDGVYGSGVLYVPSSPYKIDFKLACVGLEVPCEVSLSGKVSYTKPCMGANEFCWRVGLAGHVGIQSRVEVSWKVTNIETGAVVDGDGFEAHGGLYLGVTGSVYGCDGKPAEREVCVKAWAEADVKFEFPDLKRDVMREYNEYEPDSLIVEKKASGAPLIYDLRAMGIPVQEYTPGKGQDKIARLNSVSDIIASGKVWVPQTRWAEELVDEVAAFPSGEHDDLVDATTLALMRFRQGGFLRLPSDEPEEIQWFKSHRRERFYTV
jgi:predicted phage terminase large subunit-like protein